MRDAHSMRDIKISMRDAHDINKIIRASSEAGLTYCWFKCWKGSTNNSRIFI